MVLLSLISMDIGTTIRVRRTELRLSMDELGRRSGIERSRLSRAERGYVKLSADEIARLQDILELDGAKGAVAPPPAA